MSIVSALTRYGLTEREARVYVALLKRIEATAHELAQDTHIPRASVYTLLDSLKEQDLVSSLKKNGVALFSPESPKRLLSILQQKHEVITSVLPSLLVLSEVDEIRPMVRVYEGMDKHQQVWADMLETFKREKIKHFLGIVHGREIEIMPRYFPQWVAARAKAGVVAKLILPASKRGSKYYQSNEPFLREVRFFPDDFEFNGALNIYGNNISLFSFKDEHAVVSIVIKSPLLAKMFREFFMFAWSTLEE